MPARNLASSAWRNIGARKSADGAVAEIPKHKGELSTRAGRARVSERTGTTSLKPVSEMDAIAKNEAYKADRSAEISNLKLRIRALNAANINLKRRVKELENQVRRK